jgi:hypothetical protein
MVRLFSLIKPLANHTRRTNLQSSPESTWKSRPIVVNSLSLAAPSIIGNYLKLTITDLTQVTTRHRFSGSTQNNQTFKNHDRTHTNNVADHSLRLPFNCNPIYWAVGARNDT